MTLAGVLCSEEISISDSKALCSMFLFQFMLLRPVSDYVTLSWSQTEH